MAKNQVVSPVVKPTFGSLIRQHFNEANIVKTITMANRKGNENLLAMLTKDGKYGYLVGKGKTAVRYQLMNLVNATCGLSHGDYHPNRILMLCRQLGIQVDVRGELPISHPDRRAEYDAIKLARAEAKAQADKKAAKATTKVKPTTAKALVTTKGVAKATPVKSSGKKPLPTGKSNKLTTK